MNLWWVTGLVIGVVVLLAVLPRAGRRYRQTTDRRSVPNDAGTQELFETTERAHMPVELRQACLVISEKTLYADLPVKLAARMDQVFEVGGLLVPVETKTRERLEVDPSDALQLSVQATVLANCGDRRLGRRPVAAYGYVRIVRTGRPPVYLHTPLVSQETVAEYHRRFHALRRMQQPVGQVGLRGAFSRRVCRRCPYQRGCPYQPPAAG